MLAGLLVIYLPARSGWHVRAASARARPWDVSAAFASGVYPFILADLIKLAIAAGSSRDYLARIGPPAFNRRCARADNRGQRFRRGRRHPGRPEDVRRPRRVRHERHHRRHGAEHARRDDVRSRSRRSRHRQIEAVVVDFGAHAAKTGMLANAAIVEAVAAAVARPRDPVPGRRSGDDRQERRPPADDEVGAMKTELLLRTPSSSRPTSRRPKRCRHDDRDGRGPREAARRIVAMGAIRRRHQGRASPGADILDLLFDGRISSSSANPRARAAHARHRLHVCRGHYRASRARPRTLRGDTRWPSATWPRPSATRRDLGRGMDRWVTSGSSSNAGLSPRTHEWRGLRTRRSGWSILDRCRAARCGRPRRTGPSGADAAKSPARAGDGAVASFIGLVRDHNQGRRVSFLEYEAYEPLAVRRCSRIVDEIAPGWPDTRVGVHHRTGASRSAKPASSSSPRRRIALTRSPRAATRSSGSNRSCRSGSTSTSRVATSGSKAPRPIPTMRRPGGGAPDRMRVTVRLFARLRDLAGSGELVRDVEVRQPSKGLEGARRAKCPRSASTSGRCRWR